MHPAIRRLNLTRLPEALKAPAVLAGLLVGTAAATINLMDGNLASQPTDLKTVCKASLQAAIRQAVAHNAQADPAFRQVAVHQAINQAWDQGACRTLHRPVRRNPVMEAAHSGEW